MRSVGRMNPPHLRDEKFLVVQSLKLRRTCVYRADSLCDVRLLSYLLQTVD